MKKFKFRLQSVLEYRQRICDDLKGELLKANQALALVEQDLLRMQTLLSENLLDIQGVVPVSQVLLNAQISQALGLKIDQAKALIEIRQQEVQSALDAYQEASKDLKAVNVLKERKLQEYNKQLAEYESATLDELAIQRSAKSAFKGKQAEG
jgi:flagellar FliJ protein